VLLTPLLFIVVAVVAVHVTFLTELDDAADSDIRPSTPSFGITLLLRPQICLQGFIETHVGWKNRLWGSPFGCLSHGTIATGRSLLHEGPSL